MSRAGKRNAVIGACVLVVLLAACIPAQPPPPASATRDVMVVGDSISYSYGCVLGDNNGSGDPCPPLPDFTTRTADLGGCNIGGGTLLLYNRLSLSEYACSDWQSLWAQEADQTQPRVVVLSTSGWEIVDRWSSYPGGCSVLDARDCSVPPDLQWGGTESESTNARTNYATRLAQAIALFRSRGAQVLVANAPYVAPPAPALTLGLPTWYERYQSDQGDWVPPSNTPGYTYRNSKTKIDELNAIVASVVSAFGGNGVTLFDIHSHFSPGGVYSDYICPPPNDTVPPGAGNQCPGGTTAVLARHPDGMHLSQPQGFDILAYYLRPCIRGLLGISGGDVSKCS